MILRFTTPGSEIGVYTLFAKDFEMKPITKIFKKAESRFQLPDCQIAMSNGLKLPSIVQIPIEKEHLDLGLVNDFESLKNALTSAIKEAESPAHRTYLKNLPMVLRKRYMQISEMKHGEKL
jgi:hypothetical protein